MMEILVLWCALMALLVAVCWVVHRVIDNWVMWDYKESGFNRLYREKLEKRRRWRRFVRSGFRAPPEDDKAAAR